MPNTKAILLVDDEQIILEAVGEELRQAGYMVSLADNGQRALELCGETIFDLVITDLCMEGIDGFQVLESIKSSSAKTAVIILTGYGDLESAIAALRLGADDYLLKPANSDELLLRIEKCLQYQDLQSQVHTGQEKVESIQKYSEELELEIARREKTEQALLVSERALKFERASLEDAYTALKVVLKNREHDRLKLEEQALFDLKDSVLYNLRKLSNLDLSKEQQRYTGIIETNLNSFLRSLRHGVSSKYLKLSPMELKVVEFIKRGDTSKEIAVKLSLSSRTIDNHRQAIRKKLGLNKSNLSLRSILDTL